MNDLFIPNKAGTIAMAANSAVQNSALPVGGGNVLRLINTGPGTAFIELSSDANLPVGVPSGATAGGFPVAANQPAAIVELRDNDTRISFISNSTATVYATRGRRK